MSRKTTIDALFAKKPVDKPIEPLGAPNSMERAVPAVRTGAVAAMGASLQQWSAAAKASEDLQAQIANAKTIVELDPQSIDPAPVRDRLVIEHDPSLDELVKSIAEAGQQVPILVRPHPNQTGRFQAAYGHRRIEATRRLGQPVRAIVQALTDEALITAQGKENSERRDLSFIEKALFARRLEEAGYDRAVIGTSLSTDKADLSRLIQVARSVPEAIAKRIGSAPKAGRARWMALAELLQAPGAERRLGAVLERSTFSAFDSDRRFLEAMRALDVPSAREDEKAEPDVLVEDPAGKGIVSRKRGKSTSQLIFNETLAPGFMSFLASELPNFYRRYLDQATSTSSTRKAPR
ncbi:MAG: plasmid partitioning protein RepB [Rhizobiales bacterium PAR1]|nr:MAG: plasmid partitioning protein RepB [Rhizobiales bacterium PAR1]